MPSIVKSNVSSFLAANQASRGQFLDAARQGIARRELEFLGKIRREQMSHPRGGPPQEDGTRVQSGKLRRDWFNQSIIINQVIKVYVWSTTPYAPLHEEGGLVRHAGGMRRSKLGKAYQVRPYWVHYTKRLRVGESWEKDFLPAMRTEIDTAADKFLR